VHRAPLDLVKKKASDPTRPGYCDITSTSRDPAAVGNVLSSAGWSHRFLKMMACEAFSLHYLCCPSVPGSDGKRSKVKLCLRRFRFGPERTQLIIKAVCISFSTSWSMSVLYGPNQVYDECVCTLAFDQLFLSFTLPLWLVFSLTNKGTHIYTCKHIHAHAPYISSV